MQPCLFCGGDPREPDHASRCDGRQGKVEAAAAALPLLISGIAPETWDTSAAAAVSVEPTKETQRRAVFAVIYLSERNGATDDEIQVTLNLDGSSERPRRWELWKLGQITMRRDETGEVVRRLTRTKRRAVVWVAA